MLQVNAIDLHYGAAQALRGIKLAAEPGKVTCVLGRNGVGKTSLLRALMGQHPVSSGSILFDEADITRLKAYERARRGIAYVPQGREIFPLLTVQENLETGYARLPRTERKIGAELYFDFARALADTYAVMERGEVVLAGTGSTMVESDVRRYLTV